MFISNFNDFICYILIFKFYLVEWSCCEDFSVLVGDQILDDPSYRYIEIPSLTQGTAYYVRVSGWNMKGYGPTACSTPSYAIPSCKCLIINNYHRAILCWHIIQSLIFKVGEKWMV